jgi:hypothetical protein
VFGSRIQITVGPPPVKALRKAKSWSLVTIVTLFSRA